MIPFRLPRVPGSVLIALICTGLFTGCGEKSPAPGAGGGGKRGGGGAAPVYAGQVQKKIVPLVIEAIGAWKQKAVESIDTGLQGATTPGDKIAVMGALARCQIAMADADPDKVKECLHNAVWGPWTVVQKEDKAFSEGPIAEESLRLSLRYFIEKDEIENATLAMNNLN